MISLKSFTRILILAVAGLLSSCIDSREEYWLHADGSGRAKITYILPAAAASLHGGESGIRDLIASFLKDQPEFTTSSFETVTEKNRIQVKLDITFDSALDLRDISSGESFKSLPSGASSLAGEITANIRGRTLEYSRKITPSKALPGSAFMPSSQLEGHRMLYIMHLPVAATDSNATRVENTGSTLVWDIPLAQALKTPLVTRFNMKIPIPWTLITIIATPLSLAAAGFLFLRIRRRQNRFLVGNP